MIKEMIAIISITMENENFFLSPGKLVLDILLKSPPVGSSDAGFASISGISMFISGILKSSAI